MRTPRAAAFGLLLTLSVAAWPAAPAPGTSSRLTVSAREFLDNCRADLARARAAMEKVKALKGGAAEVLDAYDTAQWTLGGAFGPASLARQTHPDAALRDAGEQCGREASAASSEFSLDRGLYDALSAVDARALDPAARYYLERTLQRFRLAGVDRDAATRARLKELDAELTKITQEFSRNVRDGTLSVEMTPAELAGLPEDFVKAHPPGAAGKVVLKTDPPDYVPFMTYAKDAAARERFMKLYFTRAYPKNVAVLEQLLARRHEKATLLGFANWADYATADRMIGNGARAGEFIDRISAAADARARRDYDTLLARKKKDDPAATDVKQWDAAYYTDRVKAEQFGVDSREVRPYFQYENVKKAVLDVTARLFGIRYEKVAGSKVWHADVETYDVYDGSRLLGRIYLDMHPRDNKYKHYAQFTLVSGKAGLALPEGVLVCNFPQPRGDDPGLMEHTDVVTFFHEFGHLVDHVLGGASRRWAGARFVGMEWDFVEAPSQMLEEWARDPKMLQSYAIHYQTRQPIPLALAEKLRNAEEVGKGLFVRRQMSLAAISLGLHARDPKGLDVAAYAAQMQEKYTPYRYVPGTHFYTAFDHLTGYSAGYYTYMWSLVIAKDMFSAFKAQGDLMKPEAAQRYRRTVLEASGTKPAAQLVQDFLGRPYAFKAYEEWLNQ